MFEYAHALKLCEEFGLCARYNLILGYPGETKSALLETIKIIKLLYGYSPPRISMFSMQLGSNCSKSQEKNKKGIEYFWATVSEQESLIMKNKHYLKIRFSVEVF